MIQLLSPDTFEFFARYLLAGYVVIFVRSAFVIGLRPKPTELLVEAVVLSLIVQLIVYGIEAIHGWIVAKAWTQKHLFQWLLLPTAPIKLSIRVLFVPSLLGIALGMFLKSNWRDGVLRRLSLPVVHPVRRAHDFAFGMERSPCPVEITFEDGTKIAGWFGQNSLASTDDNRSDLYLERAYIIDENGDWKEGNQPRAILVSLRNVRAVEFLLEKENGNG